MGMPRLAEDASRLLAQARDEARRRGHSAVEVEHVLAALASHEDVARACLARGIDRQELRLVTEASLDAKGEVRSYRDSVAEPPLSPELRAALSSRRGAIASIFVAVSVDDLVDAVLGVTRTSSILRRATVVMEPLATTLRRADEDYAHASIAIEHVLSTLAEERWFVFAMRAAGGDVERLRELLEEAIAAREDEAAIEAAAAELSTLVHRTDAHAKVLRRRAMGDLFVVRSLQIARIATLFDAAGARAGKLSGVLVHGERFVDDDALAVPPTDRLEVVFHDDDVTTMEFVVKVLTTCFDMTEPQAVKHMLAVHGHDMHVVATLPADEARSRVVLARELAHAHSFPLRISVRRARA